MNSIEARLTGLATAVSSGDVVAAAAGFHPTARITVREGHAVLVDLPAEQAIDLITTAFTDIGCSSPGRAPG